jgi:phenylacetate-CoA ligase
MVAKAHFEAEQLNLLNRIYTNLVFPWSTPRDFKDWVPRLRRYEEAERASLDANRARQWQALVQLLQHAYETTPFYRRRFDEAGIRPAEMKSFADLGKIPFLVREDLRNNLDEMKSRAFRPEDLLRSTTGGTTDMPVPLIRDRECARQKVAIQWRFNMWAGLRPGDKAFYLWGATFDYPQNPNLKWRLYDHTLMRRVWAPTSDLSEAKLESYRESLNQFKPRIIYAYPRALASFCEYLRDCARPFVRPVATITNAEVLYPEQRQLIEEVLGCPVFDHYGTRDFGLVAAECQFHRGMHLNPLAAVFEFLPVKDSTVDGLCELVVTDLLNYGMPMIRYRVNDCAMMQAEPCPCGRGYPLFKGLIGRTSSLFRLANGVVVMGGSLLSRAIGAASPTIKKVQIIQETFNDFKLRFVPGSSFQEADLKALQTRLDEYFGVPLHWEFEKVEDIERDPSGKTRLCISHVADPRVGSRSARQRV